MCSLTRRCPGRIFLRSGQNLSLNNFYNRDRRRGKDRKMLRERRADSTQYFTRHLAFKIPREWGRHKSKICYQFDLKLRMITYLEVFVISVLAVHSTFNPISAMEWILLMSPWHDMRATPPHISHQ